MKNLYELTKIDDSGFLAFLYAERNRQNGKRGASGWSSWALIGTAFALVFYIYRTIKVVESIDILLCYYIFSVFCPIVLYFIFIMEQIRANYYGDIRHVEKLKNIAPITLLLCLLCMYALLTVAGLFWGASLFSVIACTIVLIPIFVSLVVIAFERDKLVTTFMSFRVSISDKWNKVLMFFLAGALLQPINAAVKQLSFGFSSEFEVTFAVVILISISYILIKNKVSGNRVAEIDELIDGFLYRDWSKETIIRKLELQKLGKATFMELEVEYNKVVNASGLIEEKKKRADDISLKIQEQGMTIDEIEKLLTEISGISLVITEVLNIQESFNNKALELINLKSTLCDNEFKAMLDTAYDLAFANKVFDDCRYIMDLVKNKIFIELDNKIAHSRKKEIASCEKCPHCLSNNKTE